MGGRGSNSGLHGGGGFGGGAGIPGSGNVGGVIGGSALGGAAGSGAWFAMGGAAGIPGGGGGGGGGPMPNGQAGTGISIVRDEHFGADPNYPGYLEFHSTWDANNYHINNSFDRGKWDNNLSEKERRGVVRYTGSSYRSINVQLREGDAAHINYYGHPISSMNMDAIEGAKTALDKFGAQDDFITYRGANYHWTANLLEIDESQLNNANVLRSKIGTLVTDKGFMSSGTTKSTGWDSDVTYKIYVNKGTKGMYVDPISANSGEFEWLFNSGQRFLVHDIVTDDNGKIAELVLESEPVV